MGAGANPSAAVAASTPVSHVQHPGYSMLPRVLAVGMTKADFVRLHSGLTADRIRDAPYMPPGVEWWMRDETLHEVAGAWTFKFVQGRLEGYDFHASGRVSKASFERFSRAANAVIAAYTKTYGKPVIATGIARYVDPSEIPGAESVVRIAADRAGGYEILQASWETETSRSRARLKVEPSKGEYDYVFAIQVIAKSDADFDP